MKVAGIILGGLTVALGVYALCVPVQTFFVIGWLVGMVLFANGLTMTSASAAKGNRNIWGIALGLILMISGLSILFCDIQRILTDFVMAYMIAASILCGGIVQCIAGVKLHQATKQGGVVIALGVLSIISGLIAAGHPLLTMVVVGYYMAFGLIMQGVNTMSVWLKATPSQEIA